MTEILRINLDLEHNKCQYIVIAITHAGYEYDILVVTRVRGEARAGMSVNNKDII